MERTVLNPLSDNWKQKKRLLIVVKDGRLNFLDSCLLGRNCAVVGTVVDYELNGTISARLRVMEFPDCGLKIVASNLEKSSVRPILEQLGEDSLQSVQVQFNGGAWDLVDEEGIRFEIIPKRLIIRIYNLNRVFRKFTINYRELNSERNPSDSH